LHWANIADTFVTFWVLNKGALRSARQFWNMVDVLVRVVVVLFNAPTSVNPKQLLKVFKKVVILGRLNAGVDLSEKQPVNILLMSVTFCVLNGGTSLKVEQLPNILPMFAMFCVSNKGTFFKAPQVKNIWLMLPVVPPLEMLIGLTVSSAPQLENSWARVKLPLVELRVRVGDSCRLDEPLNMPVKSSAPVV
jgi:hypothetical protein